MVVYNKSYELNTLVLKIPQLCNTELQKLFLLGNLVAFEKRKNVCLLRAHSTTKTVNVLIL